MYIYTCTCVCVCVCDALSLSLLQCTTAAETTAAIVRSLLSLVGGASYGDLASLEELVAQLSHRGHVSPAVVRALWEVYRGGGRDARAAVQVGGEGCVCVNSGCYCTCKICVCKYP